ncbi:MAG: sulfatase-like hydrolase/transferase [Pseudomonadota bacterium]
MIRDIVSTTWRCIALLASVVLASLPASAAIAKRPNILLIIGDDIGIDVTTGMYPGLIDSLVKQYGPAGHNHPAYQQIQGRPASTPTLNAFAQSGMRFTQAWVQPFCANTRASILTGLYPAKTGVLDYTGWLTQSHHSFVRDLKEKGGYATAVFGKWHMAGLEPQGTKAAYPGMKPKEAGFDLFLGNLNGGLETYWAYDYQIQDATSPPDKWRTEPAPTRSLLGVAPTTYAPVVKVADTIKWITEQKATNPGKPWFVWLAFNLSHITGKQVPNPMAVPNIDTLDAPSRKEMQACGGTFGSANVGDCSDKALMRAMTNSLDTLVGKLLKTVDALDPNTFVIYLGDNGTWMFGNKREFIDNMYITRRGRGKGTSYEAGAQVEMAIRGPGIKAGSVSNAPVDGVDLFPTILKLAGLDSPASVPDRNGTGMVDLDGVSLAPILFHGAKKIRDPDMGYLLAETTNPVMQNMKQVGARNAKYKIVCTATADAANCQFYDLIDDPLEEYPLTKPDSCAKYQQLAWKKSTPEWNFCRLQEVVSTKSFLAAKE